MSAVSEWVVREYFEHHGYLVSQPRKYAVPGRAKSAEEEVDLVVINPNVTDHHLPPRLIWHTGDLLSVARAVVGVRGWHTERFYVSRFEQAPDILRFVEPDSMDFAQGILGEGPIAKVLCLPRLPASGDMREKSLALLSEKGVDGIISFSTILSELILSVDCNRNYEKSDLLQILRLLKNYDLLKDEQLELFGPRPRV